MTAPAKTERKSLGKWGEEQAAAKLLADGYRIEARNWRCRYGEIDIIAFDPQGTLCFIEVRTRRGIRFGGAMGSISAKKRKTMAAAAALFLAERSLDVASRFDLIAHQAAGSQWETHHVAGAFLIESL